MIIVCNKEINLEDESLLSEKQSKISTIVIKIKFLCPGGEIGRHKGLKIPRRQLRAGSSPALGTNALNMKLWLVATYLRFKFDE